LTIEACALFVDCKHADSNSQL